MRPKPVAYFLCAVALALIAVCPLILLSEHSAAVEAAPFKGVLKLWHIQGWRTGGASFGVYLSQCIKLFESQDAYAFIEMESLTPEEAMQALESGEKPDLISFPRGQNPGVTLQPLPSADTVLPDADESARPYACGGYCLLVNTDLLSEQGAEIPDSGWGIRPEALIDAAQFGVAFDAEAGCSALPALALHEFPESDEPSYSTWGDPEPPDAILSLAPQALEDGLDAFLKGECAVLVASQRQLYDAEQAYIKGDGPAFLAYGIGGYTDMVQMIGIAACEDEKKLSACMVFMQQLLSASAQKKLEAAGTLPVIPGLNVYTEDGCRAAMYALLCKGAALPGAGEAHELDILAAKALGGDKNALKALKAKLRG